MTDPAAAAATEEELRSLRARLLELRERLGEELIGQREVVDLLTITLMAGGHALLEGAPGLGKTTLVHGLASGLHLEFARIQCTPDLMPSDVVGARILQLGEDGSRSFRFEPGPVFTQVLLADEINRATPRTQSALLEAMAEGQVTVNGETRPLAQPFMVVATQNPIEMEGTYPLPEAQLDRFMVKIGLELPGREALAAILRATVGARREACEPVMTSAELLRIQELVRLVPVDDALVDRVARTVRATHPQCEEAPEAVRSLVRHGASPRGAQALLIAAKARALLAGRLAPDPDDLAALVGPTLGHRVVLGYEAEARGMNAAEVVRQALEASA